MLQERFLGSVKILSVNYEELKEALISAARRIKETETGVESVSLYGSFARGDYTPLSDIDLLITVIRTDEPFLERRDRFIGYFHLPFDVNIIVYTVEEVQSMLAEGNIFLKNVLTEAIHLA
jgi:predicted nucleotidyltransferase